MESPKPSQKYAQTFFKLWVENNSLLDFSVFEDNRFFKNLLNLLLSSFVYLFDIRKPPRGWVW